MRTEDRTRQTIRAALYKFGWFIGFLFGAIVLALVLLLIVEASVDARLIFIGLIIIAVGIKK